MINTLSTKVYSEIEGRFFGNRLLASTKYFAKEYGQPAAFGLGIFYIASAVTSIGLSYFCMEGTIRSFIEANDATKLPIERIRPLGDAGGWFSIAIFTALALKSLTMALVREGEYVQVQKICKKWLKNNVDVENSAASQVYVHIEKLLEAFNRHLYFPKPVITRRLAALNLIPKTVKAARNSKLFLDQQLKKTYVEIDQKLAENTATSKYLWRVLDGFQSYAEKGCLLSTMAAIFGVAIPLILFGNACISIVGEFGLGHDLFINRTGLEDIGHFGEWPVNAIEALSVAFFLHFWYIINESTLSICQKVYAAALESLQAQPEQYNRVCAIANQELAEAAAACHYLKYPHEYVFQKI